MASRGQDETMRLKANVEDQLNRLLTQLQDIEELRADLDDGEYESTRQETLEQMKAFEASLQKMMEGSVTLVDEIGGLQLAIQAAIRQAFKIPEVIKMFAKREPDALRARLAGLEEELKLARISQAQFDEKAVEIVTALQQLGEEVRELVDMSLKRLTTKEEAYASRSTSRHVAAETITGQAPLGENARSSLLSAAESSIRRAR